MKASDGELYELKLFKPLSLLFRKNILTVCKQAIDEREKKGKESQVRKGKKKVIYLSVQLILSFHLLSGN